MEKRAAHFLFAWTVDSVALSSDAWYYDGIIVCIYPLSRVWNLYEMLSTFDLCVFITFLSGLMGNSENYYWKSRN